MQYPERIKGEVLKDLLLLLRDAVNAFSSKELSLNVKTAFALSESEQKKAEESRGYISQADALKREIKSREDNAQSKLTAAAQTLTEANNVKADNEAVRSRNEKTKVELEKRERDANILENKHKLERIELDNIKAMHDERARKLSEKEKALMDKEAALNERAEKIKQAVG